ncbi:DUF2852 domain-containing protein [Hyphomicrobium sp.]|jgi:hypothetical protein|uniref:DUF2852 domain-containing protein n=1 Tax=Hyphomicrobium sp. TaxID=82 RepID=UPI002D1AAC63|nr:DUF2852 domain-containing protein [Hyphomicrobium sp.]HVZ05820.1 DUF2852 domain-containing protein [Hyphomicrobium sp.]
MRLLFLPLLPLLFVPFFVTVMVLFAIGAVLMRIVFIVALLAIAAAALLGGGLFFRGTFRGCASRFFGRLKEGSHSPFDKRRGSRDSDNFAFDEYRRATLRNLEDEAREFRTFLAKLRDAADATDFQAFLKSRRAGGPHSS